jgi:hypothetical protein
LGFAVMIYLLENRKRVYYKENGNVNDGGVHGQTLQQGSGSRWVQLY